MKRVVSTGLCFAVLIAGVTVASAMTPEVRAVAAKTDVLIAETFTFRVEVIADPGCEIEFNEPVAEAESNAKQLGVFEILNATTLEDVPLPTAGEDQRLWSRTYSLETIRLGEQTIPPIGVTLTCDGQTTTLKTDPVEINVAGVIEQADEPLREIAGALSRETEPDTLPSSNRIVAVAAGLAVTAVCLAMVLWYRRRVNQPLRWCANELLQLKREGDSFAAETDGDATRWLDFTQRLREILRVALTVHLDQSWPSPSTSRLMAECQQVAPELDFQACQDVLGQADTVKFGAATAKPLLNRQVIARLNQAVGETEQLIDFVRRSRLDRKRGR